MLFAADLSAKGLKLLSQSKEDGLTVLEMQDGKGNIFSVGSSRELSDAQVDTVAIIKDGFYAWKYLKIRSLKIIVSGNKADIVIIPESFVYKEFDFAEYLPAGMKFYFDAALEYDFRAFVQNLFLRIKGQFFTEEQFCEKLHGAFRNPAAYLQSQDPEFIVRRFDEVDRKIDKNAGELSLFSKKLDSAQSEATRNIRRNWEKGNSLKSELDKLRSDVNSRIKNAGIEASRALEDLSGEMDNRVTTLESLTTYRFAKNAEERQATRKELLDFKGDTKKQFGRITEEGAKAVKYFRNVEEAGRKEIKRIIARGEEAMDHFDGVEQDYRATKEDYLAIKEDYSSLKKDYAALKDDYARVVSEFEHLRNAVVVLHNRGWFGTVRDLNETGIKRVLALKKENPALTTKEMAALLKEEGVKMSGNEIFLVFSLFLNEFK